MTRLAEERLQIEGTRAGTFWVSGIGPERALRPRLGLIVGCELNDVVLYEGTQKEKNLEGYQLVHLAGVLRWDSTSGPIIGDLKWSKSPGAVTSLSNSFEHQLTLTTNLTRETLERLEELRQGRAPKFGVTLEPVLLHNGKPLRSRLDPFGFSVARENWHRVLDRVDYGRYDVIEVRLDVQVPEQLKSALEHLEQARTEVQSGRFREAVGACRKAIEATTHALGPGGDEEVLKTLLVARTDEKCADWYYGIISRLKQLSAAVTHHYGESIAYDRQEALFLIRATEAAVSLLGNLASGGAREIHKQ